MQPLPESNAPAAEVSASEADEALVRAVAAGDRAAARGVVDEHLDRIHRFAARMLGNSAEAEDVAQETMLRLWQQATRWEGRARLRTWLLRVARNLCIDRLRARRDRGGAAPDEMADGAPTAPELLERLERARAVSRALGELPERQRAALSLVYFEGLRNDEAAEVLEISVDALESLLARGRRQLGVRLGATHRGGKP